MVVKIFEEGSQPSEQFPETVFTDEEVEQARILIEKGYKHSLRVIGSQQFTKKVDTALTLIKTAKYYDFFRTYIRSIIEVNGLSQLREAEASIWANTYTVADPLEAAGLFIQKAEQMKSYLEGKYYYSGVEEAIAIEKRSAFLLDLKRQTTDQTLREQCEAALKFRSDSVFL